MLFAVLPVPNILPAIWPKLRPEAVFIVVLVLDLVAAAVNPCDFALDVHTDVLPVALVVAVLEPDVFAYRFKNGYVPLPCIVVEKNYPHNSSCLQTLGSPYRS